MTVANQRVSRPALAASARRRAATVDNIVSYPLRSGAIAPVAGFACALRVPSRRPDGRAAIAGLTESNLRRIEAE
jgi:hypothetical protein